MNRKHLLQFFGVTLLLAACSEALPHTPAITVPAQPNPTSSPVQEIVPNPTPIQLDYTLPLERLTAENVTEIEHLYDLGQGFILGTALSPDEQTVAVQTANMLYLYDTATLTETGHIDSTAPYWYLRQEFGELKPVAFSPGGNILAYSTGKHVSLWDFSTNQRMEGSRFINAISDWEPVLIEFSPKGEQLLIITNAGYARCDGIGLNFALYDLDGTLLFDRYSCGGPHNNYYRFTEDNKFYLFLDTLMPVATPNEIYVVDLTSGALLESSILRHYEWTVELNYANYLNSDDFFYDVSADGKLLAAMEYKNDNLVTRILDAETRELIDIVEGKIEFFKSDLGEFIWQEKDSANPYFVDVCDFHYRYSTNYKEITSTQDNTLLIFNRLRKSLALELWDIGNCEQVDEVTFAATTLPIFSPDGRWVAVGNGFDINIFDIETGNIHFTAPGSGYKLPQDTFIFNNDGTRLITSNLGQGTVNSEQLNPGFMLQVWDTNTGQLIHSISEESSLLKEISLTPYKDIIITRDTEGSAAWDIQNGIMLSTISNRHFAFGQNKTIWVPNYGDLYQHDLTSGRVIQTVALPYFSIKDMVINNKETRIFATTRYEEGGDQFLTIFDATTGQILNEIEPPFKRGWIQISNLPNDSIMLSHIGSEVTKILDFHLEQPFPSIPYSRNAVVSPDGNFVAFTEGFVSHFWDLTNGDYLGNVLVKSRNGTITFSPDGRLIAITGKDGLIELWGVPQD